MLSDPSLTVRAYDWMLSSNWLYPSKCVLRPIPEPHDSIFENVCNQVDLFDYQLREESLPQEIGKLALRVLVLAAIQFCVKPVSIAHLGIRVLWRFKDKQFRDDVLPYLKMDAVDFGIVLTTLPVAVVLFAKNYKKTAVLVSAWSVFWFGILFTLMQRLIDMDKSLLLRYKFGLVGSTGAPLKYSPQEDHEAHPPMGKIGMLTYLSRVETREFLYLMNQVTRITKLDVISFDFAKKEEYRAQFEPLFVQAQIPFDETIEKLSLRSKRMEVLRKLAEKQGSEMLAYPLHDPVVAPFFKGEGVGRIDILADVWGHVRKKYAQTLDSERSTHARFNEMKAKLQREGIPAQEFLELPPDFDRKMLARKRQELLKEFNHDRLTQIPQKDREAIYTCINEATRLLEMQLPAESGRQGGADGID